MSYGLENTPDLRRKLARIVATAWVDPEYRGELLASPREVFASEGIESPPDVRLTVVEDTPGHRHVVLADKPLPPQNRVTSLPPHPDFYSVQAYAYERARTDPEFKRALESRPAETLRGLGARLPRWVSVSVHEDTETDRYFVLPLTPRARVSTEALPPGRVVLDVTTTTTTVNASVNINANLNVNVDTTVNGAVTAVVIVAVAVLI
jgi:hypothetical protein